MLPNQYLQSDPDDKRVGIIFYLIDTHQAQVNSMFVGSCWRSGSLGCCIVDTCM